MPGVKCYKSIVGNFKSLYKETRAAIPQIIFTIIHFPLSATGVIGTLFGIMGIFFLIVFHLLITLSAYPFIRLFFKTYFSTTVSLGFCLFGPLIVWLLIYYAIMKMINFLIHFITGMRYFDIYFSSPLCYYFALKFLTAGNTNLHLPLNSLYLEVHLPLTRKYKRNPYLKDALVEDAKLFLRFLSRIKLIKGAIIYGYTPLAVGGLLKLAGADVKYTSIPTLIDPERALSVRTTKKQFNFYTIIYKRKESPTQKNIHSTFR
ncbi:MAG: hypothetical protein PWR22_900 [Moorella sp. (in: firmicutes)]|nr:hypothetical protein [Moorella sp. (in: firmicutes)]